MAQVKFSGREELMCLALRLCLVQRADAASQKNSKTRHHLVFIV